MRQTVALILAGMGIVVLAATAFHLLAAYSTAVESVVFLAFVVIAWVL